MRLAIYLLLSIGLVNCSQIKSTESEIQSSGDIAAKVDTTVFDYDAQFQLENYLTTDNIAQSNTDSIDFDCAILIYPTSDQINEMKKNEGEEDFYIGADDSNWYQAQSIDMIDSVGIRRIVVAGKYLHLIGQSKTWNLDIRRKNMPAWNLIFFKQTKEPQVMSTIDLTVEEVKKYFEILE